MVVCLLKLQLSIAKNPYLNNLSLTFILCFSYTLRHLLMCVRNLLGLNYRTMAHVIGLDGTKFAFCQLFYSFLFDYCSICCALRIGCFFLLCGLHSTCFYRLTYPSIQLKSNKRGKKTVMTIWMEKKFF